MRHYPSFKELSAVEQRNALLVEGRRSERILKLYWLAQQRDAVRGFLAGLTREVNALRRELAEDHGFDRGDLRDAEQTRPRAAGR